MLDELGGDREVVPALDPLAVAAGVAGHPLGLELQRQDVREPLPEPVHRRLGAGRVGERYGDEVAFAVGEFWCGEEILDMAAEHGELPVDRRGDPFGARLAVGADLDQPAALLVVRLGERVRQRRAAVAHVLRDRLLAVQVAERHVAEPVEQARRDVADAADRDVPLGVAGPSPGHPGVRHHDRAPHAARRGVGPDARRRLAEDGRVSARPVEAGQADRRLQVRHAVDGHRAVVVAQHDRLGERRGPGAQVHAGGVDERAAEPEAARGVVVAADHDHAGAGVAQPHERLLAERHRVHRRHRAVVDVARDEHGVHSLPRAVSTR